MMRLERIALLVLLAAVPGVLAFAYPKTANPPANPEITLMRTPHGGIQPQTILDRRGVLHMIYFKGDPSAGDIEYVRREPGARDFSAPVRVNSQFGSALAVGTVRGPQMALGSNGAVFVVWFGSRITHHGTDDPTPLFFSRRNDPGAGFATQRNLIQYANGIDGGLSVAASSRRDVYVVWHATGQVPGEAHRRVYMARSTDGGGTFVREVPISPASLGACGCCGMRAFVDVDGRLYVLYRAAAEGIHRDMTLLVSADRGQTFRATRVAPWELNACPMSTDYLGQGEHRVLAAWQTADEVYFNAIDSESFELSPVLAAPGRADDRKHPALAANSRRQVLLVWTEGTGWLKGGSLAWQLFDPAGQPVGPEGHAPGVPVWGLPSVFADHEGNFSIVY
jgi:hypothetical protein